MGKLLEITPQSCGIVFGKDVTYDVSLLRHNPKSISLVVFTGGSDVLPELYGENIGRRTSVDWRRDIYESKIFDQVLENKIPMVGICRGSQFLCVKAGGKICQDVIGHTRNHHIRTSDGRLIECNSSHHQMMLPPENSIVLAWAEPRLSEGHYWNGDDECIEVEKEYEVVYYPEINALGIQGHPEYLNKNHQFVLYSCEMVNKYLFGGAK